MVAALGARLALGETLGDRILKVDHAGEHGAVCIYSAQRWIARWRAPHLLSELDGFLVHERRHRALFAAELARRGRRRCRSFWLCGAGGLLLGAITGLAGVKAIHATTVAVERVVLRHLEHQLALLYGLDPAAHAAIADIVAEERGHHDLADLSAANSAWRKVIEPVVAATTEAIIWLGMRL